MRTRHRLLSCGTCLLCLGCFNPMGSATETVTTGLTEPATVTSSPTATTQTSDPTSTTEPGCGPCPADAPYCHIGMCIPCGGSSQVDCVTLSGDPDTPVCNPNTGHCVQCFTGGDCDPSLFCDPDLGLCGECLVDADCVSNPAGPICDEATRTCRGCDEHAECAVACELDTGVCFPDNTPVYHATPDDKNCETSTTCDMVAPCCSVQLAVDRALMVDTSATFVAVRLHAGLNFKPDGVLSLINPPYTDRIYAVLGDASSKFEPAMPQATPVVHFGNAGASPTTNKLFLANISIAGADSPAGIGCEGGLLWVDDTTIANVTHTSNGSGLSADNCRLVARRTLLSGNQQGLSAISNANVELVNTIIGASSLVEVVLGASTTLDANYITVVDADDVPSGLLSASLTKSVTIRNSALLAVTDPSILSSDASLTIEHSAVTDDVLMGGTNTLLTPAQAMTAFVDWQSNWLLNASPGNPLENVALWDKGSPTTDFQKQPRPAVEGAMDYAGADRPGP